MDNINKTNNQELLDLSYITSLRIGVFYLTRDWKDYIYNSILYTVTSDSILKQTDTRIDLKTGTSVRFIKAHDRMKGIRFQRVILEPRIDENIYNTIIYPMLDTEQYKSMVITESGRSCLADTYYYELNYLRDTYGEVKGKSERVKENERGD